MKAFRLLALASVALVVGTGALAQSMSELPAQPIELPKTALDVEPEGSPFVIYPVRGNVYMISGPGANATVQIGPDGILVVDPGPKEAAAGLLAQIKRLSRKQILNIINTTSDAEYIGANATVAMSGEMLEGGNTRPKIVAGSGGAPIFAEEKVLARLTEEGQSEGVPSQTYFVAQKDMFFNNEPVSLLAAPGHTDGESFVMFRRSDVISAGAIYTPDAYPVIDLKHGGSIQNVMDSLNYLLRLTITEFNEQGGTFVIPGHGRLSDEGDVADYRDMVTFIHDRVKAMIGKKMSLTAIKAARPTLDYDSLYGKEAGDAFVDQIYASLTSKGAKK